MTTSTDLVPLDDLAAKYPVLDPASDMAETVAANIGDEEFNVYDLDKVNVPAGGGTSWDLPDGDPTRKLVGIPVGVIKRRSYWEKSLDEADGPKGPPDCSSDDTIRGRGAYGEGSNDNPSGLCATCPMNQFQDTSNGGRSAKPCKEQSNVLLMTEGSALPLVLQLAPTSIKVWRKFMLRLTNKGVKYYRAIVSISLKKIDGNPAYSVIEPDLDGQIDEENGQKLKTIGDTIVGSYAAANGPSAS